MRDALRWFAWSSGAFVASVLLFVLADFGFLAIVGGVIGGGFAPLFEAFADAPFHQRLTFMTGVWCVSLGWWTAARSVWRVWRKAFRRAPAQLLEERRNDRMAEAVVDANG